MKKKKNRPLFPNGYKKKVKESKSMGRKKKEYTENQLSFLKSMDKAINALSYRLKKNKGLTYEETVYDPKTKKNITVVHDIELAYKKGWEGYLNTLKGVRNNFKKNWKEGTDLTDRQLTIMEHLYTYKGGKSQLYTQVVVADRNTRNNKLILETLEEMGVDISDPVAVQQALGDLTPEEVFKLWEKTDKSKTYYEVVSGGLAEFLSEANIKNIEEDYNKVEAANEELKRATAEGLEIKIELPSYRRPY